MYSIIQTTKKNASIQKAMFYKLIELNPYLLFEKKIHYIKKRNKFFFLQMATYKTGIYVIWHKAQFLLDLISFNVKIIKKYM